MNPNMVYVAGLSFGGQMAERVGVELAGTVAAIVAASGQLEGQTTPPPVVSPQLPQGFQPISVQEWHARPKPGTVQLRHDEIQRR